jgi:hypothetical protein
MKIMKPMKTMKKTMRGEPLFFMSFTGFMCFMKGSFE